MQNGAKLMNMPNITGVKRDYRVIVQVGEDEIRRYAVHATDPAQALNIGTEYVRDLVNGYVPPADEWDVPDAHIAIDDLSPVAREAVTSHDRDERR